MILLMKHTAWFMKASNTYFRLQKKLFFVHSPFTILIFLVLYVEPLGTLGTA